MSTTSSLPTSSSPPSLSRKSALFVVNILTPSSHNNPQYRVASELCPGKRGIECLAGDLAICGYTEMLRIQLAEFGVEGLKEECNSKDADEAAENGYLEVIRDLRVHDIHCTTYGADCAAENGHLEI